jgi:hypothetical protein
VQIIEDSDPIILLSDRIFEAIQGHSTATAIAAMGTCLALALEQCHDGSPEADQLMAGLKMLVGEVVFRRISGGIPACES